VRLQRAHALRRVGDARCVRPVRVLLGVRHRRFLCRPTVHRKQRVQGAVHTASVGCSSAGSSVPANRLHLLPFARFQILQDGASYQEIIACDKIPPNDGCKGGVPRLVWDWAEAFSIASNECFYYTAGSGDEAPSCEDYLLNSGPKRDGCEHK
jgi:hypothetical protein